VLPSAARRSDPGAGAAALIARLRELVAVQERWLTSVRELLADHDKLPPPVVLPTRSAAAIGVSAGPFTGIEALRRFERALSSLPQVREVVLREYAGDDGAVVDVHLYEPIS
jgi:hypothetical protein